MGRWSQRNRRGGGGPVPWHLTIVSVIINDQAGGVMLWEFSGPVTAADFDPEGFVDFTIGERADSVGQDTDNVLSIHAADWEGAINVGDSWGYDGNVFGVVSPQSGLVT